MPSSAIVHYYSGEGVDGRGRTLAETQGLNAAPHGVLSRLHPVDVPNPATKCLQSLTRPTLSDEDVAAFLARPELQAPRPFATRSLSSCDSSAWNSTRATRHCPANPRTSPPGAAVFAMPNHNWLLDHASLARSLKAAPALKAECRGILHLPPNPRRSPRVVPILERGKRGGREVNGRGEPTS